MASNEIQRLKLKFETKNPGVVLGLPLGAPPPRGTPAFHEMRMKEQKARQANAAKQARANAARYNLTMRALALTSARLADGERNRDLDEVTKARELASHYNATARALKVTMTGVVRRPQGYQSTTVTVAQTGRIATKISEGSESPKICSPSTSTPAIAPVVASITLPESSSAMSENTETKLDDEPTSSTAPVVEVLDVNPPASDLPLAQPDTPRSESPPQSFSMPEVEQALKDGKDDVINEVLVRTFLAEVDPVKASDSGRLLEEYKGREDELMEALLKESETQMQSNRVAEKGVGLPGDDSGNVGFITAVNVNRETRSISVSVVQDNQIDAFKTKLLARGISENEIIKMMEDTSEML